MLTRTAPPLRLPQMKEQRLCDAGARLDDIAIRERYRWTQELPELTTSIKLAIEKHVWWPRLLQGEAEINVDACEAGESTNLFSSTGSRLPG